MAIIRIPLTQPISSRKADLTKDSRSVNCYFEARDQGTREFVSRPGYASVALSPTLSASTAQGMYRFNSKLYVAINNVLSSITTGAVSATVGTMTGTVANVFFAESANNNKLFVHNQTNGYTWNNTTFAKVDNTSVYAVTITTGGSGYVSPTCTFSAPGGGGVTATGTVSSSGGVITGVTITNAGSGYSSAPTISFSGAPGVNAAATVALQGFPTGPLATGAVYLDGYTIIASTAGQIYSSDSESPDMWNPLNYLTAEADPDPIVGICKHFNYVCVFGEWGSEFFYDAATTPGSPLARQESLKMEIGCANGQSIVQFEQAVIFVGKSKSRGKSVYLLNSFAPEKISTRYIEKYLNADTTSNIVSTVFKIEGHTLYILTMPTVDQTFVYDLEEKQWYQWTSFYSAAEHCWRIRFTAEFNSTIYGLDVDNGLVYNIATTTYTDNGTNIYCRSVTNILDAGTTKRKFFGRGEIVGDKIAATMQIRHVSDDYVTWSSYRNVTLNATRAQIYQQGVDRRRAYEFYCPTSLPLRLDSFEVDVSTGELQNDEQLQTQADQTSK
jgi:hypothetical protein